MVVIFVITYHKSSITSQYLGLRIQEKHNDSVAQINNVYCRYKETRVGRKMINKITWLLSRPLDVLNCR